MANALYDYGREGFLDGSIDWDTDTIKAVLVDSAAYTLNLATHQFLSDIPGGARTAVSLTLTGKTKTAGVADASDTLFQNVSGATSERVVLYKHTGVDATSRLIAAIDTAGNLPVQPQAGDILVVWDNGTNRIFKL